MPGIEVKLRELCNQIVMGEQSNGFLGFQRKTSIHHTAAYISSAIYISIFFQLILYLLILVELFSHRRRVDRQSDVSP